MRRNTKTVKNTASHFSWSQSLAASLTAATLLVASAALDAAQPAAAWRSIGPAPPGIEAAVVTDSRSGTIYIGGTGGGILKSTDRGASFHWVNTGLDSLTIFSMAMVPRSPNIVYAGTAAGIYKTTDGGGSWHGVGGSLGAVALVMDPTNPLVLYTGSSPNGGVAKTTDGGLTWTAASNGLGVPPIFSLAIDPNNPRTLFAGTAGVGAYKTVDAGAHWTPLQIDSTVWSLLVDPANSQVIYAGSNGSGVYRSDDGGARFYRVGSPRVGVVLTLAKSGDALYAGTATEGVSVSDDGGVSWRNGGAAAGLGLILSVDDAGAVYLGTNFEGAFVHTARRGRDDADGDRDERDEHEPDANHQSRDGRWHRLGWEQLKHCACQNGHAIAVDPSDHDHVFLSTNDGGLLVTRDGGQSWRDGGTQGFVARAPRGIAFDPQNARYVYAGSFTGSGFFKSDDHGRHWQRRLFGSSAIYTTGVSVDPFEHAVYVATLSGDGVWKSSDYGDTFTRIDRAPGAAAGVFLGLTGRGITVDPHIAGTVYVAASRGKSAGIWRSRDAGLTWSRMDPTPTLSVTVDPGDSRIVYAATSSVGVLKSTNGGDSFSNKSAGLTTLFQTSRTGNVLVNPVDPNIVYVGTEGAGVFKSVDAGEYWEPDNLGLDDLNVFGLALDPVSPQRLYASTAASVYGTARRFHH